MSNKDQFINKISSLDLKKLNTKELANLSEEIRNYIIEKCSINGGHLASNLGVVELTIALHRFFDLPKDKLLFDVGHQGYTHKILTGRSLDNLRKENGVDGFLKKSESEYDCLEAGHSSTSLSYAMGMAIERDQKKEDYQIISLIGDASLSNGLSLEALHSNQNINHKVIIIINDNNMSKTTPVGALHNMLQSIRLSSKYMKFKEKYRARLNKNKFNHFFYTSLRIIKNIFKKLLLRHNYFELLGYYYIGNVDGYDFKEMEHAFKKAKKINSSVIIHVTTVKGKGYNLSESENVSSWHSVKPFDIKSGKPLVKKEDNKITFFEIYANELENEIKNNPRTLLINPATTIGSGIEKIMQKYPNQAIDVGINEEHAITLASGYANKNNHAYVSMYSTFLQRSYDQINHDLARMDSPVTLLIERAGLVGPDGETHQGIFDESFLLNMPNVSVCMAKDYNQAISLFNFSKNYQHPLAIRYPLYLTEIQDGAISNIELGKWEYEKKGTNQKICLISFGPNLNQIINKNLDITIVNAIFQSPLDVELLKELLDYQNIIIYDPYGIEQGFAFHLQVKLLDLGFKNQIHRIALKNEYVQKGTIIQQEKRCHVDIESVTSLIEKLR